MSRTMPISRSKLGSRDRLCVCVLLFLQKLMRYSVFLCVTVSHELSLRHSQLARMRNVARGPINFMWYSVLQYVAVPHELSLSHIRQIRVRSPNRFLYPLPRTFLQINLFGGNHIHGLKRRPDNKFGRVKRGEINKNLSLVRNRDCIRFEVNAPSLRQSHPRARAPPRPYIWQ